MDNVFMDLYQLLESGQKVVLARIVRQVGSAPRTIGTKCLILEDGKIEGTIGGGYLEYLVIKTAQAVLRQEKTQMLYFKLTGKEVAETDMLCGGEVDVYLEPIFPDNASAQIVFQAIRTTIADQRRGVLVTRVAEGLSAHHQASRVFIAEDGSQRGELENNALPQMEARQPLSKTKRPRLIESETPGRLFFIDPIGPEDILFIFGAGHVSTFVAPLAKMVGFQVKVIDDRPEFANKERFPHADEIIVAPFLEAFERITISKSSYMAIITRGHIYDRDVLRASLQKHPAYIGMIGSRRKRDLIYKSLRDDGISQKQLETVHSPIGIHIGGETPEEIAISIVAELIQVRYGA